MLKLVRVVLNTKKIVHVCLHVEHYLFRRSFFLQWDSYISHGSGDNIYFDHKTDNVINSVVYLVLLNICYL